MFLGKMLSASQEIATSNCVSTVLPTSARFLLLYSAWNGFIPLAPDAGESCLSRPLFSKEQPRQQLGPCLRDSRTSTLWIC